jgi:hypothetical protein
MRTSALGKLVADSWRTAEEGLREKIRAQCRDSGEEFITGLLRGELEALLIVSAEMALSSELSWLTSRPKYSQSH